MKNNRILYIGRFELPDKEATANRVVANAKLLRDLGYEVALAGWSSEAPRNSGFVRSRYFNFDCYEKHKAQTPYEKYMMFSVAKPEIELLKHGDFSYVIAYDFPAVALKKIMRFCRKKEIVCLCDVSEWYTNNNKNWLFRIVRMYDSQLRMKILHKRADGLIVISTYFKDYYKGQRVIEIPPLVDKSEEKWDIQKSSCGSATRLVYAGWPSKTKERLDLLTEAVECLSAKYPLMLDIYGITEKQYRAMYAIPIDVSLPQSVNFHGRVSHIEALQAIKNADYSMIIRESNRKNNAGFPSKLVESISCGTPVLTTSISNVRDYVSNGRNGFVISTETLQQDLEHAICNRAEVYVEEELFDYRKYREPLKAFIDSVGG